eukprot:4784833-Amphidinium_carterae.1
MSRKFLPVENSAAMAQKMSKDMPWIKLAFGERGVTSVSDPLDRAIMRPLKTSLQRQVASQLGNEILATLSDGCGFDINGGQPTSAIHAGRVGVVKLRS